MQSGITIAETFIAEAEIARGRKRKILDQVARNLRDGEQVAVALEQSGGFPTLLIEMSRVGDEAGVLGEVFLKLANHYRDLVRSRRVFYQGITWPLLQAAAGTLVITLFLLALHYLQSRVPNLVAYDLFQLGLTPLQNLALFWGVVLALLAIPIAVVWCVRKGLVGNVLGRFLGFLPLVGSTWERMATSRFAWSFGTAIDAGVDAVHAVRLGLRGSHHHPFQLHEQEIVQSIERGNSFESSFRQTGVFPTDFLQAVSIGERTGRVTESVQRLSEDYEEQSALSLRRLGQVSGIVVSLSVFALIGVSILAMYAGYMGEVAEALNANTATISELRDTESGSGESSPDNSILQTRDRMVKDFVENNEDFQKIESIYTQLGRFGEVSNNEFLDGLLGKTPAQQRAERARREREAEQRKRQLQK